MTHPNCALSDVQDHCANRSAEHAPPPEHLRDVIRLYHKKCASKQAPTYTTDPATVILTFRSVMEFVLPHERVPWASSSERSLWPSIAEGDAHTRSVQYQRVMMGRLCKSICMAEAHPPHVTHRPLPPPKGGWPRWPPFASTQRPTARAIHRDCLSGPAGPRSRRMFIFFLPVGYEDGWL